MEKSLPHNIEAEYGVIGSVLIDPEAIALIADTLKASDFYKQAHKTIYTAIVRLYEKQEPADFVTLCDYLQSKEQLEQCGNASYITSLINHVPTSGNIEYYASIVRREAMKRALIKVAGQIAAIGYDAEDADTALQSAEQLLFDVSAGTVSADLVSSSDMMANFMRQLDHRQSNAGKVVGIPLGFRELNFSLGGLQPQELYILGGRPGTGKSSLMLNFVYDLMLAEKPYNIAVFSLEMSEEDVSRRLISMDTGIDSQFLRTRILDHDDLKKVIASTDKLSGNKLFVDQSGELSIAAIRSKSRRHKMKHGLDLVIVDYLQLMQSDTDNKKQHDNRVAEIGKISRGLKQLAKELQVPVLALASLNRAVEGRADKRPMLSDLRDSGSIESDADVVMFISKHPEKQDTSVIDIAKHRHGKPTGDDGIELSFNGALTMFSDPE